MNQIIIHVDMDAFYASVEMRDDPSLRGKPLIIGSLPNERGVVATCSYEARKYGVHSAMNIKEAYRLCPNGVYMHPNFDKYRTVSEQLHTIWNAYASASEYIALDEAYLDVTERARTFEGARTIGQIIKERTRNELGLSCSVGIGYSKTAAKTASEEKKPNGFYEIPTKERFVDLILDRDVRVLYTVGEKTAEKLKRVGIRTVRDVRQREDEVVRMLGKQGEWIVQLASGMDDRRVVPYRPEDAKSIGREVTFQEDVSDFGFLGDILLLLSLSVERRARRVGLFGKGMTLKITYANMKSITRSHALAYCDTAAVLYRESLLLLEQIEKAPVRLIGVSLNHLSAGGVQQLALDDYLRSPADEPEAIIRDGFFTLQEKYHLDFAGHLEQLDHGMTFHKTIEYMRRHAPQQ